MIVCKICLAAIESHEGRQWKKELEYDDERVNEDGDVCVNGVRNFIAQANV